MPAGGRASRALLHPRWVRPRYPVPVDLGAARLAFRALEPVHAMIYFVPDAASAYAAIGLRGGRRAYFASRAAPLGAVGPEVVTATFYNWSPALVARSIPSAWQQAAPAAILSARLTAARRALRPVLGDLVGTPVLQELLRLLRSAAESASGMLEGRPLFAAHAALPWPEDPLGVLWHAQTLLRELRGDGHIAALLCAGLDGREALITDALYRGTDQEGLRSLRGWSQEEWSEATDSLRARGLLRADEGEKPALSARGREMREALEVQTDVMSLPGYGALGDDGCARLASLGEPLGRAVRSAGLLARQVGPPG